VPLRSGYLSPYIIHCYGVMLGAGAGGRFGRERCSGATRGDASLHQQVRTRQVFDLAGRGRPASKLLHSSTDRVAAPLLVPQIKHVRDMTLEIPADSARLLLARLHPASAFPYSGIPYG
jgi:hypothetical protein